MFVNVSTNIFQKSLNPTPVGESVAALDKRVHGTVSVIIEKFNSALCEVKLGFFHVSKLNASIYFALKLLPGAKMATPTSLLFANCWFKK